MSKNQNQVLKTNIGATFSWLAMGIFVLVISFAGLMLFKYAPKKPKKIYKPNGYYDRVETLIKNGVIRYVKRGATNEEGKVEQNLYGKIYFDKPLANKEYKDELHFYERSQRLQDDINEFYKTGSGLFEINDDKIKLKKTVHNFYLPYPLRNDWKGAMVFKGPKRLFLDGEIVDIELYEKGPDTRTNGILITDLVKGRKKSIVRKGAVTIVGNGENIFTFKTKDGISKIIVPDGTHSGKVYLNGYNLQLGDEISSGKKGALPEEIKKRRIDNKDTYRLVKGDCIRVNFKHKIRKKGKAQIVTENTYFVYNDSQQKEISSYYLINAKQTNLLKNGMSENFPTLEHLHKGLGYYMAKHKSKANLKPRLDITLNPKLHKSLDFKFNAYIDKIQRRKFAHLKRIRLQPAALTVMNALSGEVIAMPSYPNLKTIKKLELERQRPFTKKQMAKLRINRNFVPMEIGSTLKPILSLAIWDTHPELQHLIVYNVPNTGKRRQVAGYSVENFYTKNKQAHYNAINAIAQSVNSYFVELFFLTLAKPNSYSIDKNNRQTANVRGKPDFSHRFNNNHVIGANLESEEMEVMKKAKKLFNIPLDKKAHDEGGRVYATSFWGGMCEAIGMNKKDDVFRSFQTITPRYTVWDLQSFHSIRGKLISWLLGSGKANQWTTIKLAEAYSRIGTGRMVEAHLVSYKEEKEMTDWKVLPLDNKESLKLLHGGMAQGFSNHGTSWRLRDKVEEKRNELQNKGIVFTALAKTGTPEINKNTQSGVYCIYLEYSTLRNKKLAAITVAVNLRERGTSANAIQFVKENFSTLIELLDNDPKVQAFLAQ